MADQIGSLPFRPLQFDKRGAPTTPDQVQSLHRLVRDQAISDLFVVSHGWKNDAGDAMSLYRELFTNVSDILGRRSPNRKVAVLGVFWPSKPRYKDYGSLTRVSGSGAAASAATVVAAEKLEECLEDFKELFAEDADAAEALAKIEEAKGLAGQLDQSLAAQDEFVSLLRSVVSDESTATDEDASDRLLDEDGLPGRELLSRLRQPTLQVRKPSPGTGGATSVPSFSTPPTFGRGGAAGLGGSIGAAALKLIDQLSYYEMKERAGTVGLGLATILAELRRAVPKLRVHLVGHSFGARLVTSAAGAPANFGPTSLTLLQAAFSHHAFSANYKRKSKPGYFRSVVGKVHGPIVITHTANDDAVGVAYPIASKLAGQEANAIGDRESLFGALGRNGAVDTAEVVEGSMVDADGSYAFDHAGGRIYNLLADQFIADRQGKEAHGDITNRDVANVVASAAGF